MCYDTVGWVMWPVKPSSKWPTVCRVGRLNSTIPYHSRTSYLSLIRGACPGKLIQVISSRWDRTGYLVQVSSFMRACPGELIQVILSIELVHASSSRWSRPGELVQVISSSWARSCELVQVSSYRWSCPGELVPDSSETSNIWFYHYQSGFHLLVFSIRTSSLFKCSHLCWYWPQV